jgi:hypothetical protein
MAEDDAAASAEPASVRVELGRALADGVARAMAAGDARVAKIALAALAGLVDDAADGEGSAAAVIDLAAARQKRGA